MEEALSPAKQLKGEPMNRVDGRLKVTGEAKYAVEYALPGMTYGVLVTSTIAKGRIERMDTEVAQKAPGVLVVVTHLNAPPVPGYNVPTGNARSRVYGQELRVFYSDRIYFNHQPIALVIADTFERAQDAAARAQVTYQPEPHHTDLNAHLDSAFTPQRPSDYTRGEANAYEHAPVKMVQEYHTPLQVHNPMEPHATTAHWETSDRVTVYNKTQAVKLSQKDIMKAFALKEEDVQVHSPFVGGAFGSSSRVWPQEMAAIIGAKKVGKPVKVALRRDQVFNMVGYRPRSRQKISLGASVDGQLEGIQHKAWGSTSTYEQFTERILDPTKTLYRCPHLQASYQLVPLDMSTPCWTRGPGESSGSFAIESAIDELAYALKMDPIALRLKNFAEKDPEKNIPWSSNYLQECYQRGTERFGWSKRNPQPGSMRSGEMRVGMGMSAGIYKSERSKATVRARLLADGTLLVQSATADVGPGTATIMTQIAADALGMDASRIRFELGDSSFPPAPGQFVSHTATSVGSAVHEVCIALKQKLQALAISQPGIAWRDVPTDQWVSEDGAFQLAKDTSKRLPYTQILQKHGLPQLEVTHESKDGPDKEGYSSKSFCANFVEVHVHPATGVVKVTKVVSVVDAGTVLNHKTARSQVLGSAVWGIGMALMEEGILDHRYGRYVNNDLASYHLPVQADIPPIDVIFIDQKDPALNPMGAKGLGEIGLVGFTAAVANAVYHATGKRIRELPITPDKLI